MLSLPIMPFATICAVRMDRRARRTTQVSLIATGCSADTQILLTNLYSVKTRHGKQDMQKIRNDILTDNNSLI